MTTSPYSPYFYSAVMTGNHTYKPNADKNEAHYDKVYARVDVSGIINKLNNFDAFFADAVKTDTSWRGLYMHGFAEKLKGKKVLELGCGDGLNAAVLAKLGAIVTANDISARSGDIIDAINTQLQFDAPITFIKGDFLQEHIAANTFDIVVGKAFVHHLSHGLEELFMERIAYILKPGGEVRFFEPAINSKWLDELRWYVPVSGRPSKFQSAKFAAWQQADPHPIRNDSSKHYRAIGLKYFATANTYPIGAIERLHRLLPKGNLNRRFRRFAYSVEALLPAIINNAFARSQLIVYRKSD